MLIMLAWLCSALTAAAEDQIFAQYPIGTVVAGRDAATTKPVYEQIVAALSLPAPDKGDWSALRLCTRNALGVWGHRNTDALDDAGTGPYPNPALARVDTTVIDLAERVDPARPETALTPAVVEQQKEQRVAAIDAWLRAQVPVVRELLLTHCGASMTPEQVRAQMRLLVSVRHCPAPSPKENFHPCTMKGLEGTGKVVIRERAFAQLFSWTQSRGSRLPNQWFDLSQGTPGQVIPVAIPSSPETIAWTDVSMETKLRQFETHVHYLRSLPKENAKRLEGISAAIPRAIGLTQESGARIIDLVQSPIQALDGLPTGNQVLSIISDEVARSRITECVRLRRVSPDDIANLAKCSGYDVTDETLNACLNMQRCLPAISATAMASVLRIVDSLDLTGLVDQTQFPRISNIDFDAWEIAARTCASENKDAPGGEKNYQTLAMDCVMNKSLSSSEIETYKCVQSASGKTAELLKCIPALSPELQGASQCWNDNPKDIQAALWCSGKASIKPEIAQCVQGFASNKDQSAALRDCLKAQLGEVPRLAEMLECAKKHGSNRNAAALCMAAPDLKDLSGLATCGASASNWQGFATCALKDQLPKQLSGDVGRVVACGMQTGGSPVGTAVCLAGSGLNATQQVIVECAASSGGEPLTFAACSGGRLALKEFIDCKDKRFAQDQCFGKNNEIRRLVRALGLPDIGPNSVVADIANVGLDVIKAQVRLAENVFKAVGNIMEAGGKALEDIGSGLTNLAKETERLGKNIGNEVSRGWDHVRKFEF